VNNHLKFGTSVLGYIYIYIYIYLTFRSIAFSNWVFVTATTDDFGGHSVTETYRVSIKSFPDYKHLLQENYCTWDTNIPWYYIDLRGEEITFALPGIRSLDLPPRS